MFLRSLVRSVPSRRPKRHILRMYVPGETNPLSKLTTLDPSVLHVVSVPIGNMKDFSLRALDVLKNVDFIVCHNKNHTRVMLDLIDIPYNGRLLQLQHENPEAVLRVVKLLKEGYRLALVSNAGTPSFGDPCGTLIAATHRAKLRVSCVPGPCSITAALTMSGLDYASYGYHFIGYTSASPSARQRQLYQALQCGVPAICVLFEVPERLLDCLRDIASFLPTRRVSVVHEITKIYEAVHCDEAYRLYQFYQSASMHLAKEKGECVVCVDAPLSGDFAGSQSSIFNPLEISRHVSTLVHHGQSLRSACILAAGNMNVPIAVIQRVVNREIEKGGRTRWLEQHREKMSEAFQTDVPSQAEGAKKAGEETASCPEHVIFEDTHKLSRRAARHLLQKRRRKRRIARVKAKHAFLHLPTNHNS